ncbi:MAG: hypothetical protein HY298_00920 [Verrucomicrobia bacterium]|nr:hypothetical protein [Verrucomicrobiota bacterium]
MQLRYDEDFIEAAVFLCASSRRARATPGRDDHSEAGQIHVAYATSSCPTPHPLQIARFHREREKLYAIPDPDERNAAFFRLNLEWFREWGLEKRITDVLKEFPLLPQKLSVLAVRKSRGRQDEGAELHVNEAGQRSGVMALRPESLARDAALKDYLRHEFTHLHDMLDPAFGYVPVLDLRALNGAQQRLARERYRLLWDITIDGRLVASGHAPMATREQHAAAFARGCSFWPEEKRAEIFDALWHNHAPRHADFLALISDPRGLREAHQAAPGAPCPLCGFTTFDWSAGESLPARIASRIIAEFPGWSPKAGLCGRCRETYEVAADPRFQVVCGLRSPAS